MKQDQQNQRKVIEEKTRTGKAPTENELELKVSRLMVFFSIEIKPGGRTSPLGPKYISGG